MYKCVYIHYVPSIYLSTYFKTDQYMHIYIYAYIHTYIPSYPEYIFVILCVQISQLTEMDPQSFKYTYINTYIHIYIHTYK